MKFSLTKHNLGSLIQKLKELDFTKMWKIEIKEGKYNRSVDQNKYLWHNRSGADENQYCIGQPQIWVLPINDLNRPT